MKCKLNFEINLNVNDYFTEEEIEQDKQDCITEDIEITDWEDEIEQNVAMFFSSIVGAMALKMQQDYMKYLVEVELNEGERTLTDRQHKTIETYNKMNYDIARQLQNTYTIKRTDGRKRRLCQEEIDMTKQLKQLKYEK